MTRGHRKKGKSGGNNKGRTDSFRKQIALTVIKENLTLLEAAARFGIPGQTISRWVLKHYDDIEQTNVLDSMKQPSVQPPGLLEYESKLRQAQLKIMALETMIELAENTYRIAIRKNSGTKQPL
jgi:transposase-like protein